MTSLAPVDKLSDEETLVLSPSAGEKAQAKLIAKSESRGGKAEPKGSTPKEKSSPKPKGKNKVKSDPSAAPKTKAEPRKRPAASPASAKEQPGDPSKADAPAMKKPATREKKDVRVSKSEYKRDGVWSVKLNEKEVVRVFGLQLACLGGCALQFGSVIPQNS